jgi:hypothetical protein
VGDGARGRPVGAGSSPAEQEGLGAERLIEQDLSRPVAAALADATDPASPFEPWTPAGSRTTPSSETFSLMTIRPIRMPTTE